jgi:type IV pilus assembly protein PilC
MPIFNYTSIDFSGKKIAGTVDARSKDIALSLLKDQGLFVVDISEKRTSIFEGMGLFTGVPEGDVVTFTRQFSTMITAGLPISRALEVLTEQNSNLALKKVLISVLRDIEGGASLSAAFGRHPDAFPTTYQALVRAGESSGKLDLILKKLADNMEAKRELQAKFTSAMVYPAIVLVAMIGVFFMLMIFVIPKLADMYKSLNVQLPAITQLLINLSDFMVGNVYFILLLLAGAVAFIRYFMRTPEGRDLLSYVAFNVPIFGKINRQKELTEFTRTVGLLISSAIPIVEVLNIVSGVVSNKIYKEGALDAARYVEKGNALSDFFKKNREFPPLIGHMTKVGEETGKLDEVLIKVSEYYDSEVDHLVKGLSAALEPVILILLGGMVGILIVAIITPIYKITSAL